MHCFGWKTIHAESTQRWFLTLQLLDGGSEWNNHHDPEPNLLGRTGEPLRSRFRAVIDADPIGLATKIDELVQWWQHHQRLPLSRDDTFLRPGWQVRLHPAIHVMPST